MGIGVIPILIRSFSLLPIPIPKLESYSHSHGIPIGFPFLLEILFLWPSLICSNQVSDCNIFEIVSLVYEIKPFVIANDL